MGYSITQKTADRINRYRREDRLCQGSGRCSSRATYVILFRSEGKIGTHVLCKRHLRQTLDGFKHYGYLFENDRGSEVLGATDIGRGEHGTDARAAIYEGARNHGGITEDDVAGFYEREKLALRRLEVHAK